MLILISTLSRFRPWLRRGGGACLSLSGVLAIIATPGLAQETAVKSPKDSVIQNASDAFGTQQGIDRVGLYNENQVRGFDLAQSGAYRIEDHYFAKAAWIPETLSSGLSVNVGITAATLNLPSPSGVVVYRLRQPDAQRRVKTNVGFRDFGTVHADLEASFFSRDERLSAVVAIMAQPVNESSTRQSGDAYGASLIGVYRPDARSQVRLFTSYQDTRFDGGVSVNPVSDKVPPPLVRRVNYAPDWARSRFGDFNAGLLFDGRYGDWAVASSVTLSIAENRDQTTVLNIDDIGNAQRTLYIMPPVTAKAAAAEARIERRFQYGDWRHYVGAALRVRRSDTDLASADAVDLGMINVRRPYTDPLKPVLPPARAQGRDTVDQTITSLTYRGEWAGHTEIRLGAHRSHYEKAVVQPNGQIGALTRETWFHNASAIWRASPRAKVFASYVSGLEESGVAPPVASNRGEVLTPVEARQWEIGASYEVKPKLTLIAAVFDITKPVAGLRADGVFSLVGDVRHRGVEISLAGKVTDKTSIVLGAVALDPVLSGPAVEAGTLFDIPAGVSRNNITVNIEHRFNDAWSVDGQWLFEGRRRMRADSATEVDGVPYLTLGATRSLRLRDVDMALRFQYVNALDATGYFATASNLVPVWSRTYRLSLSTSF